MTNIIIIFVVALIVGASGGYVYVAKKKGKKCIGCPESCSCDGRCAGCKGCGEETV